MRSRSSRRITLSWTPRAKTLAKKKRKMSATLRRRATTVPHPGLRTTWSVDHPRLTTKRPKVSPW